MRPYLGINHIFGNLVHLGMAADNVEPGFNFYRSLSGLGLCGTWMGLINLDLLEGLQKR
jgi:hypothetical protein